MPRNNLFFCLLCFCLAGKAQTGYAWYPFVPGVQYNFAVDSAATPILSVIKIDSTSNGPASRYHFNKIVSNCDTCHNASLANDPYDSAYVLTKQAQFTGHYFYKTPGNGFYFKGPHSFLLLSFQPPGSTWLFDTLSNIQATLAAKSTRVLFGIVDSVCIITLSSIPDTIILSKSHGIIRFPLRQGSSHYYQLAGLEGAVQAGVRLRRFHDFFDLQAGDIFQYTFTDQDYNNLPPLIRQGYERWDVLSATIYTDSVRCKIKSTYLDSLMIGNSFAGITSYAHVINVSFIDSLSHPANLYPQQETGANAFLLYPYGGKYIHKISTGLNTDGLNVKRLGENCPNINLSPGNSGIGQATAFEDIFLSRNSLIVGREFTEGLGVTSELFNNVDRIYQRCLTGYVKNGVLHGTVTGPLNLAGISAYAVQDPVYSIYPSPAHEQLFVYGPLKAGSRISLTHLNGAVVLVETIEQDKDLHRLKTGDLATGLYFLQVSKGEHFFGKKILLRH